MASISQGQFSGNAASASKWATPRTITLTGSVTGSVSIDGSANVSLATTTNHTHTFASLTSKPTTLSGYGITDANNASTVWSAKRLATPDNLICPFTWAQKTGITGTLVLSLPYGFNSMMQCIELTVYDYSSTDGFGGATKFFINGYNYSGNNGVWINPYVFRIGNKNVRVRLGYYNNKCCILIGETNTTWNYPRICVDKVYGSFSNSAYAYKDDDWSCAILQDESQITHVKTASDTPLYAPCYTRAGLPYVTDNDVAAKYLPLSGGILNMNKSIGFRAYSAVSGGGGWALDCINFYDRAATKRFGGLGYYGDNLNLNYIYLGTESYSGVNLRICGTGQNDLKWGTNPILHTGNYNSYAPKLDGTGATGTWGINISGNAATATNADKLDGYHASMGSRTPWGTIPAISLGGFMDVGKHFEFHYDNTTGSDYSTVLGCTGNYSNIVNLPSKSGTLALVTDNVASATKLQNSRTIWGQSFDGTGNVSGSAVFNFDDGQRIFIEKYAGGITCCGLSFYNNKFIDGSITASTLMLNPKYGGNVGIGTTSPAYKLDVVGAIRASDYLRTQYIELIGSTPFIDFHYNSSTAGYTSRIIEGLSGQLTVTGKLRVGLSGTTSTDYDFHVVGNGYYTGNLIAGGDLTAGSDIRYKDKIQDLRLSVHDIALAPAFTYKWNNREDDALIHIGSSAQYWLNTDAKDAVYYDKQNDFYHLNYASLALCNTIILARGMETQEEKIARLEERINELEDKLRQYDSNR